MNESRGEKKFHLVNWKSITTLKCWGGLAIKDLRVFYKALLGKWLWRFRVEVTAFWRGVTVEKYGGWRTKNVPLPYRCELWRNISKRWEEFNENTSFRVGEASSVSFWGHRWCGNNILGLNFPNMYRISCQKRMSIIQLWNLQLERLDWTLMLKLFHTTS